MENIAIIQARLGSSRLPGKVFLKLEGVTVLEHVVNRVKKSSLISGIFVATTISESDIALVKFCSEKNFRIFCGSENDVLDRFYQLAKLIKPDNIIRITSDCPMIDPTVIGQVIYKHIESKSDYTTNTMPRETFPDGEDVEVFTFAALEKAWNEAKLLSEREHVTPYIRNHPELFKMTGIEYKEDLSGKRWTLDNSEDYEFISRVYNKLYSRNKYFGMSDIIEFLKKNPDLEKINIHIKRNEGYQKSLMEDKKVNGGSYSS